MGFILSQGMWGRGKREGGRWVTSLAGVARNAILGSQWRIGSVGCVTLEWGPAVSSSVLVREGEDRSGLHCDLATLKRMWSPSPYADMALHLWWVVRS